MTEPEDTDIQRLIRLKRYEQPPEGFVDDFLINFHHRQRSEILRQSSLSLFWERLVTFMDGRAVQGMGLAGATAALLILGGSYAWSSKGGSSSNLASETVAVPSAIENKGSTFSSAPIFGIAADGEKEHSNESLASSLNNNVTSSPVLDEPGNGLQNDVHLGNTLGTGSRTLVNGSMMMQNGSAANIDRSPLISPTMIVPPAPVYSPYFSWYPFGTLDLRKVDRH